MKKLEKLAKYEFANTNVVWAGRGDPTCYTLTENAGLTAAGACNDLVFSDDSSSTASASASTK
ncbi:MAG: hypothetical protein KA215_03215 [Flavobacterium sp.]|nr:hypothetical protein [Flavobacterium sp.]